jgi:aminoglycoside 3-N-acetyltransferase
MNIIRAKAYHTLRKLTSQQLRQGIRNRVWQLRLKSAPLLKAWYGTYGTAELEAELHAHLPADFEVLMVHSSISDMQPTYQGTARDIVALLLQLVGPYRTLAMPAFFFGSLELYNRDHYRIHPQFDVRRTPSQMGIVTEVFRRSPGVARSLHPTHSVCALGPLAGTLLATHHLTSWACGEQSPFGVMGRHNTVILGLGTEYYRALTQVHAAEERMGNEFPIPREHEEPVRVKLVDTNGKIIPYEMSCPLSRRAVLHIERLKDFASPDTLVEWSFKGTHFFLTTAAKIDEAVRTAALRGETLYSIS